VLEQGRVQCQSKSKGDRSVSEKASAVCQRKRVRCVYELSFVSILQGRVYPFHTSRLYGTGYDSLYDWVRQFYSTGSRLGILVFIGLGI
jgi:hypothetical protein